MAAKSDLIRKCNTLAKDSHYRVGRLARLCGVSRRKLERQFSGFLRTTPKAWLTNLLFRRAKRRLRGKKLPLKELAPQFGFRHAANFCRAFRKHYGRTPTGRRRRRQRSV